MGHQGPSVRLALYVDIGGKLQAPGAGVGASSLGFGRGRGPTVEDTFGKERKGGMQEVRVFTDGLRRNWQRRLERRRAGLVKVGGGEEKAGTHGLAGSMVHLHLSVLLPLFVFFLLFLLCLLDLKLLGTDLGFLFFIWTEGSRNM